MNPWELLGVEPGVDAEQLAAARRRLAFELHPDRGGDHAAMQAVNAAYDEALRRTNEPPGPEVAAPAPAPTGFGRHRRGPTRGVQHDNPSFTIDVLPAEAFEALLVVTSWIGEVLVDDPPYVLEVFLHDPLRCWCRLDLVPDAGGTTVSLTVAAVEGETVADIDQVRDTWVAGLNEPIW